VVQPGDTLSGIAQQFGTTTQAIAAANNITDPTLINVGQTLTIPAAQ
jgi:putative chitinase